MIFLWFQLMKKTFSHFENIPKSNFIKPVTTHWTEHFSSGLLWKTFFRFVLNFHLSVRKRNFVKVVGTNCKKTSLKISKENNHSGFNVKSLSWTGKVSCWFSLHFHCSPEKYFCRLGSKSFHKNKNKLHESNNPN